jgi:hypothetical protein
MAAGKRVDYVAAGRADLDALAVKFGLGNRDAVRREPADDRNLATDVGDGGAKAGQSSGGQQQTRRLIELSFIPERGTDADAAASPVLRRSSLTKDNFVRSFLANPRGRIPSVVCGAYA